MKPSHSRLAFVDNLRILLTVLVVLVHASVTYGGEGSWYWKERAATTAEKIILTTFNALSQSFFMGLFYFLAGVFTTASYDRKGPGAFLRDRLLRLGIPLLAFDLVLEPLTLLIRDPSMLGDRSIGELYLDYLRHKPGIGAGPLWFVELLLIFSLLYIGWRAVAGSSPASPSALPRRRTIFTFTLAMGIGAFIVRLWLPMGWAFAPMNLQLPFCVQYVCMFVAGVAAGRRGWLDGLAGPAAGGWGGAAAATALVLPVLALVGGGEGGDFGAFQGGVRWQAFAYALWEGFACVAFSLFLLRFFRERLGRQGVLARECAAGAYTVYIIHAPILVAVTVSAFRIRAPAIVKFAGASAVAVSLCFATAAVLRRLPGLRRIL